MIQYKSLDFLGYPNYRVDSEGNIYRFRFWQSGLNITETNKICELYKTKKYNQKQLSQIYNVHQATISNIINTNEFWIKMKPTLVSGYLHVILYNEQGNKNFYLHRIICEAFHGPCPEGMQCCHNNGNKNNIHAINLRWDTPKNNTNDKIKHNTLLFGDDCPWSKISKKDVIMIRYLNKFCTQREIAKIYNINYKHVNSIILRKSWQHI